MLALKDTPNIFLLGQEYGIYFLFLTFIFTRCLRNIHEKKFRTRENTHEKKFGPTKYLPEKNLDPRNTHEKKNSDPRNTHEKKLCTHKIPTRKNYGPTKARWHNGTRPTRLTMARDPRNLAHST